MDGGKLGRFGWKGQVPTVSEFARDAVSVELGMTLPYAEDMTFGRLQDDDAIPDPEFGQVELDALDFYMSNLGPPPRQASASSAAAMAGEGRFGQLGCDGCHVPALNGPDGPVPLYSDLLLHDILPEGSLGIEEAGASMTEFRTPPLWGVSQTGPWLHDGRADTLTQAIEGHDGEAASVAAWQAMDAPHKPNCWRFSRTLMPILMAALVLGLLGGCGDKASQMIPAVARYGGGTGVVDTGEPIHDWRDPLSTPEPHGRHCCLLHLDSCAECHLTHVEQWSQSVHAHAMTDPVFRGLVAIRSADFAGEQDAFCT